MSIRVFRTFSAFRSSILPARGPARVAVRMQATMVKQIESKNAENKVIVYSKTYCPYCSRAKSLFQELGVDAKVIELDNMVEGQELQASLQEITGSRTVPQVFVDSKFLGGASEVYALHDKKGLVPLLDAAGVAHN